MIRKGQDKYQSGLLTENEALNSEFISNNEQLENNLNESDNKHNKKIKSSEIEERKLKFEPNVNDKLIDIARDKISLRVQDEDNELSDGDIGITETTSLSTFRLYSCLNTLDQNDKYYTSFIQRLEFGCLFDVFMLIPTVVYSFIGITILILIYSIAFQSMLYFVNSFLCLIINETVKRSIKRRRPNLNNIAERMVKLDGIFLLKRSASMPSGDTAQAAVFTGTMIYTMNWYFNANDIKWWWTLVLIPIAGFGRIYFGKHWIGDTLCGGIEGGLICLIVCSSIGPYLFF